MRTKIVAGNFLTLLIVGLLAYFMVKTGVEDALLNDVNGRIASDYRIVDRSIQLSGQTLLDLVSSQAEMRSAKDVFVALDERGRRERAFTEAQRLRTWLGDPARGRSEPPDIVAIVDDTGHVVARDSDRNRMFGEDVGRSIPAVRRALEGLSTTDFWNKPDDNKVLQIAVAPIRADDGRVSGALLVGCDLSNGLANAEATLLGREVAFVTTDRVYSSSLSQGRPEALNAILFNADAAQRPAQDGSAPFVATLGGDEFVGLVGPVHGGGSGSVAVAVLGNRTAQLAKAAAVDYIAFLTGLGLIVVAIYGFLIGSMFLRPIEQIEEGILQVINGRTDLRLEIQSAELGGLAYRVNQLLNVFTGTPETDESGNLSGGGARWTGDESQVAASGLASAVMSNPAASAPGASTAGAATEPEGEEVDPAVVEQLANEPEDAYYERVFREYVSAKEAAGENVSSITQDKFVQRLKANEQSLLKKHGSRMVRFQVQVRGNQVNLKPVVIR